MILENDREFLHSEYYVLNKKRPMKIAFVHKRKINRTATLPKDPLFLHDGDTVVGALVSARATIKAL